MPSPIIELLLEAKLAEADAGNAIAAAGAAMLIHLWPEVAKKSGVNSRYQLLISQVFQEGDPELLAAVGEELVNGKNLASDGKLAGRFFERANTHSPFMGAYMMGKYLVSKNPRLAVQLLKKAQLAGHIPSAILRHKVIANQFPFVGGIVRFYFFIQDWFSIWKAVGKEGLKDRLWRYRDLTRMSAVLLDEKIGEDRSVFFGDVLSASVSNNV